MTTSNPHAANTLEHQVTRPPFIIEEGTPVFWHDPDNHECSGYFKVAKRLEVDPRYADDDVTVLICNKHSTSYNVIKNSQPVLAMELQLNPPENMEVMDIKPKNATKVNIRRTALEPASLMVTLFKCYTPQQTDAAMDALAIYNKDGEIIIRGTKITRVRKC